MKKPFFILMSFVTIFGATHAQRGHKSISLGPVISFPTESRDNRTTGIGLEGDGQYNFSDKSSVVIQLRLTHFTISEGYFGNRGDGALSLKGGYRYQFSKSGFYANALIGIEQQEGVFVDAAAIGAGKRIAIKDVYFIDAGIDYGINGGGTFDIKATFSIFRRPKSWN